MHCSHRQTCLSHEVVGIIDTSRKQIIAVGTWNFQERACCGVLERLFQTPCSLICWNCRGICFFIPSIACSVQSNYKISNVTHIHVKVVCFFNRFAPTTVHTSFSERCVQDPVFHTGPSVMNTFSCAINLNHSCVIVTSTGVVSCTHGPQSQFPENILLLSSCSNTCHCEQLQNVMKTGGIT
jgi:hypothetical protein